MIFKAGQRECFVYITLPGHSIPVTAGKFTLTPDRTGTAIDRYRYGKSYLGRPDAVPPNDGGISLGQAALAAFGRFDREEQPGYPTVEASFA